MIPSPTDPLVLGIDAGSSSTRWLLWGADGAWGRGTLGPLSGLALLDPDSAHASDARARVDDIAARVHAHLASRAGDTGPAGREPTITYVVAGVTGLSRADDAADALRRHLASALAIESDRVEVTDDATLAYHSVFAPGEGVVVYAGTGSIATYVPGVAPAVRVGGHGYLVDDAGGGFWIGRHALRTVLRKADRRGGPALGALAEEVYAALGSREWPVIRTRVYGGGRRELAMLVPAVHRALDRDDRDAHAIVGEAGAELARLAATLTDRLGRGPLPVGLAGGVSAMGEPLVQSMTRNLPAVTTVRSPIRTPVETAARLAATRARER